MLWTYPVDLVGVRDPAGHGRDPRADVHRAPPGSGLIKVGLEAAINSRATRGSAASERFGDHAERYRWVLPGPDDRSSAREQDAEEQRPERAQTGERAEGRETGSGPGPGV
jgi:hypothetical protein